ncbi:helix-turn-helix domain-containing protein [Cohnella suwonensis]|uniref:Helix-turn-helix domain-containing protein n=1 Tax=Cohnella suwonensis TaxID=696072 RepID=A0ABW0M128_9BACL
MFRIVVVEDEPLLLQSIADKIRSIDPDFKIVGEYENGEYAWMEWDLVKPHVLLTDIYMPVMDGLSLIELARRKYPDTQFAILTGYRDFEYARKAIDLGVSDFLLKPPSVEQLARFLAAVKARLMKNQALVETEWLTQWAYQRHVDASEPLRMRAEEYFYHAHYAVFCAWTPPEQEFYRAQEEWGLDLKPCLNAGENIYVIPGTAVNQRIAVIGVHRLTDERIGRLLDCAASGLGIGCACIAAGTLRKLPSELQPLLAKLSQAAIDGFPLEGVRTLFPERGKPAFSLPLLPIPEGLGRELDERLAKMRKSEFLHKLDIVFHTEAWSAATRVQWIATLRFRLQDWMRKMPDLSPKAADLVRNRELEEAVWQAGDAAEMSRNVKELFGAFFDSLDREGESDSSRTEEIKRYLESHYMRNIGLTELADRFGMNPSYLGRVFKRRYGHSPIDCLTEIRLAEAKRLIREKPRLLFKDIAEMVGYSDPFYFSKLFKHWTGQTPREYKKQPNEPRP